MATIQETAIRISKAARVSLAETGIIFSDTVPRFGDAPSMEAFRRFLEADGIEVVSEESDLNDRSSATRHTGRMHCNHDAPAGFAAPDG